MLDKGGSTYGTLAQPRKGESIWARFFAVSSGDFMVCINILKLC